MIAWYHLVDNATSSLEVVGAARDYFASWTPHEISLLPERCRPGKVRDASDIEFLHDLVVDEYRDSHATGEELSRLQELTSFLVRASQRLGELGEGTAQNDAGKASRRSTSSADFPES
jgi:hypothetical protein